MSSEEAGREARPGEDPHVRVGEREQVLLVERQASGPRSLDHLGEGEVVAEGDETVLADSIEIRLKLAEAGNSPVRDPEPADPLSADLFEQRIGKRADGEGRIVAVQDEDVDPVAAEQPAHLVELGRDERRLAVRRVAALRIQDDVIRRAPRAQPPTDRLLASPSR